MLQDNLAAHELMQIGRQILTSLIAEQIAHHEYQTVKKQIQQAQEVQAFLQEKFTNEDLYRWMQGEISGLYYEYYRFAFDTARKAEQTMKQELMRPELDAPDFVKFNYWDGGRKGLLSGEALYLDVKRMEMAYHDNNKRELELTRHVSLRQLDPLALLSSAGRPAPARSRFPSGSTTATAPATTCAGSRASRCRSRRWSGRTPASTARSPCRAAALRKSPLLANGDYARDRTQDDDRFVDYFGATDVDRHQQRQQRQRHVRDQPARRALPAVRGRGRDQHLEAVAARASSAPSTTPRSRTSSCTSATPPGRPATRWARRRPRSWSTMLDTAGQRGQALLFCLRYDFPTEWSAFVNGTGDFAVTLDKPGFRRIKGVQGHSDGRPAGQRLEDSAKTRN